MSRRPFYSHGLHSGPRSKAGETKVWQVCDVLMTVLLRDYNSWRSHFWHRHSSRVNQIAICHHHHHPSNRLTVNNSTHWHSNIIIIIITITQTLMFMVLSSWPWSLREFTRFIWWMQTERRVAANPQTKPTDLGCESADNGRYYPHPPSPFVIITQAKCWYSCYHPIEGGMQSQPRHCSKAPMSKALLSQWLS